VNASTLGDSRCGFGRPKVRSGRLVAISDNARRSAPMVSRRSTGQITTSFGLPSANLEGINEMA
jgi:hypothetical protein